MRNEPSEATVVQRSDLHALVDALDPQSVAALHALLAADEREAVEYPIAPVTTLDLSDASAVAEREERALADYRAGRTFPVDRAYDEVLARVGRNGS